MKLLGVILAVVLAIGLSSTSCAYPVVHCPVWSISPDFTPDEVERILDAGSQWNAFVGNRVVSFQYAGATNRCQVGRINNPEEYQKHYDESVHKSFAGYYSPDFGTIWIYPAARSLQLIELITMHEFGHSLGLPHLAPNVGIMSPAVYGSQFSYPDHTECVVYGPCSLEWVPGYPRPDAPPADAGTAEAEAPTPDASVPEAGPPVIPPPSDVITLNPQDIQCGVN